MTEVTDADRQAAASVAVLVEMRELILAGRADHHAEPWTRHREAAEAPLRAEIERLKTDAARYQWLRDRSCPPHNFYISVPDEFSGVRYASHEVDAYIDQARAALAQARGGV